MRQLKYYIACTVDQFIAREDGSFDFFLFEGEQVADLFASFPETIPAHVRDQLGISDENKCFDAVLMGRRTIDEMILKVHPILLGSGIPLLFGCHSTNFIRSD